MNEAVQAPELAVKSWLNTDHPLSLGALRGRVVALYAFQMLCPGCVQYSMPQARQVDALFDKSDLAVIGLHTVFEHHEANTEAVLKAFVHENRLPFPIAIDMPAVNESPFPTTMYRYQMRGTPTLIVIDREGRQRKHKFGHEHDLVVGAELAALIAE